MMTNLADDRVLVVAAHPDDEVLGCGGTIGLFRRAGVRVRVIMLAEGITARFNQDQFDQPDVQEMIHVRQANALKALSVLGVEESDIFQEERYCCRLDQVPLIDLVKQIEHHINDFKPTRIFSHSPDDPNIDHGLVYRALLAATRPLNRDFLRAIYAFEVPSSTEWNPLKPFMANVFFDISTTIDDKIKAMAAYGDEMRAPPHPRSEKVLRALARVRGAQCGADFAEGFTLVRSLGL